MERRSFVKFLASIPLIGCGLAGGQSESVEPETKFSEQWFARPSPTPYVILLDQWELAAKSSWKDLEKELKPKQALLGDQQAITPAIAKIDLNENRYYDPRWNVSGSWNKAESRTSLISHLNGSNHGHKRSYLETLSTDELQKLHDTDHNSRTPTRRRRWFR